jgi:hypothetical protein
MHGLVTTPRGRRSRTNRTISRRSAALADPGVLQNWVREEEVKEAAMQRSTLRWAQIAGWAGIAGVAVAVVGLLVTWFTK